MSDTHPTDTLGHGFEFRSPPGAGQPDDAGGVRGPVSREPRRPVRAEPARGDGGISQADGEDGNSGAISGGRRGTSGGGSANGSPLRPARGRGDRAGPDFNIAVPPNGYAWWYVDGVSDCGAYAVSVIAFIGSVFSPWYRWSGRRDPDNHVCINVATYGRGGRFAMTDRGRSALRQTSETFEVGPSRLIWTGRELLIDVNEMGSLPMLGRIKGRITLTPSAVTDVEMPLTSQGTHVWRPFAPVARIAVNLNRGWSWEGHGYFDANFGTRALEQDFSYWTWWRYPTRDGALCVYDATRRDGDPLEAAVTFDADGTAREVEAPPRTRMRRSLWAVRRDTRADPGTRPRQVKAMLDAPFYTRSVVETTLKGETVAGVHEALDLDRFASPLLKPMLAVRVPRRARWRFG